MTAPRLMLRTTQVWTIEVPVRGGGWAIPVHGVDAEGYALDPHDEIEPQRELKRLVDAAWRDGKSAAEVLEIAQRFRCWHAGPLRADQFCGTCEVR